MEDLEAENIRLRAWLQTIKDNAAEVRVIDMAEMALEGCDQLIEFPKAKIAASA